MGKMQYCVVVGSDGYVQPTGVGCSCDDNSYKRVGMPNTWPRMTAQQALAKNYKVLTSGQIADALSVKGAGNGSLLSSQYSAVDVPNSGPTEISRNEMPGNFGGNTITYTVVFDNTAGLAVDTYRVFGDYGNTYALGQGLIPVPGDLLVIGGTAGTVSLSHLTTRTSLRAITVSQVQFEALNASYFTGNNIIYFDTTPNPFSGTTSVQLPLSSLVGPNQFNPNIQIYEKANLFDGVNGLKISVPAGEKLTATFTIKSEQRTHAMNLLGA